MQERVTRRKGPCLLLRPPRPEHEVKQEQEHNDWTFNHNDSTKLRVKTT